MGKLKLYGTDGSPPVRAVKLTLAALGLDYDYQIVDILKGEHQTEDYIKKNPQHTVPMLKDGNQWLWDSHAICAYLVRKYARSDSLYPKDYYQRAVVDQRLYFETGVIFQGCLRTIAKMVFFQNITDIPKANIDAIYEAYDFLESFLAQTHHYMAGNHLTIADFSMISSVSSTVCLAPIQESKYPKLTKWMESLKSLAYYEEANGKGAQLLAEMFQSKLKNIN